MYIYIFDVVLKYKLHIMISISKLVFNGTDDAVMTCVQLEYDPKYFGHKLAFQLRLINQKRYNYYSANSSSSNLRIICI